MNWLKNNLSPILTVSNILAAVIAGYFEKKAQSFIFSGIFVLFGAIFGIAWLVRSLRDEVTLHKSIAYRKKRYENDCKAKKNGRANGGLCLKKRRSILSYKNKDLTEIDHRKEFFVTALVEGVRVFTDRYRYSADNLNKSSTGICKLHAPEKRQIISDIWNDAGFIYYSIQSQDAIPHGESRKFVMEMETIPDPQRGMRPFLSSGIYEPTEELELILNFQPGTKLEKPRVKVYKTYDADVELYSIHPDKDDKPPQEDSHKKGQTDQKGYHLYCKDGEYRFTIQFPIYHYLYKMVWD